MSETIPLPLQEQNRPPEVIEEKIKFSDLWLSEPILKNLAEHGYEHPTPIQAGFIPQALGGKDLLGQANTGTGKTAAFLLPIFQRIKPGVGTPAVLILAPTRELAAQIQGEIQKLGRNLGLRSLCVYGGASYEPQIDGLAKGADIVVGTPGRLMDHMRSRRLNLQEIKVVVLDEADRMLDLGFRKDIEYILRHCPETRQTMLLSATLPEEIKMLARRYMREYVEVLTSPENLSVKQIKQWFVPVTDPQQKLHALLKIFDQESPELSIVFCRTKRGAKKLAQQLKDVYINAREIHGDLLQRKREKILDHFKSGRVQILVATDVASRGIDVQDITHIFNYDIPERSEDYVHRVGRTGRMNKSGNAFTFVLPDEGPQLTEIECLTNSEVQLRKLTDLKSRYWPVPPHKPEDWVEQHDSTPNFGTANGSAAPRRRRRRRSGSKQVPLKASADYISNDSSPGQAHINDGFDASSGEVPNKRRRSRRRRRKSNPQSAPQSDFPVE